MRLSSSVCGPANSDLLSFVIKCVNSSLEDLSFSCMGSARFDKWHYILEYFSCVVSAMFGATVFIL